MKRILLPTVMLGVGLTVAGCQMGVRNNNLLRQPGGSTVAPAATAVPLQGTSSADQAGGDLSALESTLLAQTDGPGSVDTGTVDQDLANLEGTLASPENVISTPAPEVDTDSAFSDLLNSLQTEATP